MNIKIKLLVVLFALIIVFSGFSAGNQEDASAEEEITIIKWALRINPESEEAAVEAAMNEILGPKLGIHVDILPLTKGEYSQKLNLLMASGDPLDVMFIGSYSWGGNFYQKVAKGGILPIDDLLTDYGQGVYEMIPKKYWDAINVKGQAMAVPNYQILARQNGFRIQDRFLEKYGYDIKSFDSLESIEPFLAEVKANEPASIIPWFVTKNGIWGNMMHYYELDEVMDIKTPGAVYFNNPSVVLNQYETPEFERHVRLMRDWYQKGYISKDAAVITDMAGVASTGNVVAEWGDMKPGNLASLKARNGGHDISVQVLDKPWVNTNSIVVTLTAIARQSKNPEKAMQFINEINTNKELYNIAVFGIEGLNYKKVSDNRIELIENSGWFPNAAWGMGCQFNAYLYGSQEDYVWEETKVLNEAADASCLLGFVFDQEPVKNELANTAMVYDTYAPALFTGTVNVDETLPLFIEELKKAGSDIIIEEMNKQLAAWRAGR